VFADDVLQCPCGGRRSVIAIVTDTALARSLLAGLGLDTEPVIFDTTGAVVEDCAMCCRPWSVMIERDGGRLRVHVARAQ